MVPSKTVKIASLPLKLTLAKAKAAKTEVTTVKAVEQTATKIVLA